MFRTTICHLLGRGKTLISNKMLNRLQTLTTQFNQNARVCCRVSVRYNSNHSATDDEDTNTAHTTTRITYPTRPTRLKLDKQVGHKKGVYDEKSEEETNDTLTDTEHINNFRNFRERSKETGDFEIEPTSRPSNRYSDFNRESRNKRTRYDRSMGYGDRVSATDYNYGLPGLGKSARKTTTYFKKPSVEGEILFGLFPTLLALREERRIPYQLFIKQNLLESPRPVVKEVLSLSRDREILIVPTSPQIMDYLSHSRPHQGVCLDASRLKFESLSDLDEYNTYKRSCSAPAVWLVLESVQDPMNFGAILRTAYYLGVDKMLAVKKQSCSLTPVVSKASAGVMEVFRIYEIPNLTTFLQDYREKGWDIFGTTGAKPMLNELCQEPIPLSQSSVRRNTIILLGNEGKGLSPAVLELCTQLIMIKPGNPQQKYLDSLNVSVSAGIILHHILAHRTDR